MALQRRPRKELEEKHIKWKRIQTLLDDNEDKIISEFCFKLPNESEKAYKARKKRFIFHFINCAQSLISAQTRAVFRQGIRVDNTKENKESDLQLFLENVMRGTQVINFEEYLQAYIADNLKAYGTIFLIVDKPGFNAVNFVEDKELNKPYVSLIHPLDVENYEFNSETGELELFVYVSKKTILNPQTKQVETIDVFCIWTQTEYIERDEEKVYVEIQHDFGVVPVIIKPLYLNKPDSVIGNTSMEQTTRFIVTGSEMLHLACHELEKHGASLLMLHEDSRTGANRDIDIDGETRLKKQDEDSVLEWAGEQPPEYLVKELAIADLLQMSDKYFEFANDNEATQKSVAKMGAKGQTVAESGFSKIIDRQPIENNLIALANCLEEIARQMLEMVAYLYDIENDIVVEFNKDFDVRTIQQLYQDLELAAKNNIEGVSLTAYKTLHKKILDKQITDPDIKQIVMKEVDAYTPESKEFIFDEGTGINAD